MRALIITSLDPLVEGLELWGMHSRFRLFAQAIYEVGNNITILHLAKNGYLDQNRNASYVSAAESAYLGFPVTAEIVECRKPRQQTFVNHYLSGIVSIYNQEGYYWFCGPEQLHRIAELVDQQFDIVFVHRLTAMTSVLRSGCKPLRMFFDLDDIVHRVRAQTALQRPFRPGKMGYLCQVPAIMWAEFSAAMHSEATFVCSELDRGRLRRLGLPRVYVVPNALPLPAEPPPLPDDPVILFLGACYYAPNISAADRLALTIFPRVRAAVPNARLLIAGQGSLELPSRLLRPAGVEYLGYVDDLDALYRITRVVCCPIMTGSGTRLKLIEAAGYARPIVATPFAAEGLDFQNEVDILFRQTDDAIAAACVQLLKGDMGCRALGAAARARVQIDYHPGSIRRKIADLITGQDC